MALTHDDDMKPTALALALALSPTGCAHQQLSNRQVAYGAVIAVVVVGLIVVMSRYCDEGNPNACRFQ